MTGRAFPRRGFTLIELLVTIGIAAGLAALAMLVAPKVIERDRSVDAVTKLNNALQISRAMALRDGQPRGIRLIMDTTPGKNPLFVTEFQYIETPPVLVPNPLGPSLNIHVEFRYRTNQSGEIPTGSAAQPSRECVLTARTSAELDGIIRELGRDTLLSLPTLGSFHKLTDVPVRETATVAKLPLEDYPDAPLGAAGPVTNGARIDQSQVFRTYHFGFYTLARPLIGQPTEQLPVDTCVDLTPGMSDPHGQVGAAPLLPVGSDYDILFGPSGQLVSTAATRGSGHVFLWVRDHNKTSVAPTVLGTPAGAFPPPYLYDSALFPQAGEMMIIAIKAKSGGIGIGPVNWPDGPALLSTTPPSPPGGVYDPYLHARKAVGGQ